jgi:glutamyl-tRNA synthetase
MTVRVRFAPSPTGHLHIGGLRTALFNWLFARHHKGSFLVRIEDTDIERSKPEYEDSIIKALAWADLASDEPLVRQTDRIVLYKEIIDSLLVEGKAYRCYCPTNPMASEETYFKYDGRCRTESGQNNTGSFVIRIKLPLDQKTIGFNDLIRGPIEFPIDQFDDFIIARSDGTPIYNFVVVVDDAAMNITHVIRGEDHISNTPKQIVLYQACGYALPKFAHLPMILGSTGARLSKRDAATSVLDYKHNGYLPEALCNYLVRLGWAYGDQELFTRAEMTQLFSLDDVGKKSAIFDPQKLDWMNGHYMRLHDAATLWKFMVRDSDVTLPEALQPWSQATIIDAVTLYKDRAKTLRELGDEVKNLHTMQITISIEEKSTWLTAQAADAMKTFLHTLESLQAYTPDVLQLEAKNVAKSMNIKIVSLAQPLRIALIGKTAGPGVFEIMSVLGKQESMRRIHECIKLCI